jgi:hypothetical protein
LHQVVPSNSWLFVCQVACRCLQATLPHLPSCCWDEHICHPACCAHHPSLPGQVAPLRQRSGDIQALAEHYALEAATLRGWTAVQLTPAALRRLTSYAFPGNQQVCGGMRQGRLASMGGAAGMWCDVPCCMGPTTSQPPVGIDT